MNQPEVDLNEVTKMYQILGLPLDATKEDMRRARNKLIAKFHPDKHRFDLHYEESMLNERMQSIQAAFLYIMEHYSAIQETLHFLPHHTLTNRIPVAVRSYWVYTSIERISNSDKEA
ncbi:DnaJ domain-containing protein [Candidatus Berkiella aquae]|uniref:Chaperone protein DnaJ n=1 Tax=Candidatus Berkiella aquae TaxID=295108 RepID=A0A0Q9YTL9_9GAMM|nr:DnaJ domain-containing protein [Candidatus Berkiella aquae]MCS5709830.1 DnaJ domain-containing protein [Candidatus Berkiella aquae]